MTIKHKMSGIITVLSILITVLVISSAGSEATASADDIFTPDDEFVYCVTKDGVGLWNYIEEYNECEIAVSELITHYNINIGQTFGNGVIIQNMSTAHSLVCSQDDNIVKFVPKTAFINVGTVMHIGEDYGFVIKTTVDTDPDNSSRHYNRSTVIIIKNESHWQGDMFCIKLTVCATIDYFCFDQSGVVALLQEVDDGSNIGRITSTKWNLIKSAGVDGWVVVPAIRLYNVDTYGHPIVTVAKSNNLTLSNLSIGSRIYNLQSYNTWDSEYDPNTDDGYYLIGAQYFYQVTQKHGEWNTQSSVVGMVKEFGKIALGALVDTVADYLNLSSLNTFYEASEGLLALTGQIQTVQDVHLTNNENGLVYPDFAYAGVNTRTNQIAQFGRLVKDSSMLFDQTAGILCYGKDEYIEARFNYSHTDGKAEPTRLDLSVGGLVIDNREGGGNDAVVNEAQLFTYKNCGASIAPSLSLNLCQSRIYYAIYDSAIPSYVFTPTYNGTYALQLDGNVGTVEIDGQVASGNNGCYLFEGIANTPVNIVLRPSGDTIIKGTLSIDVHQGAQAFPSNQTRITKIDIPTDGIYAACNNSLQVNALLKSDFSEYRAGGVGWSDTANMIPLPAGTYYLLVDNDTDHSIEAGTFLEKVTSNNLVSSVAKSVSLTDKYSFYRASAERDKGYCIAPQNESLSPVYYTFVDSTFCSFSPMAVGGNYARISSQPIDTYYYVGVRLYEGIADAQLLWKQDAGSGAWLVDGASVGTHCSLERNRSYTISYFHNGQYTVSDIDLDGSSSPNFNLVNNTFTILPTADLGQTFVLRAQAGLGAHYDCQLTITTVRENKISLSATNTATACAVNWTALLPGITEFDVELYGDSTGTHAVRTVTTDGAMSGTVNLLSMTGTHYTRAVVRRVVFEGRSNVGDSYETAIDNWFGGGSGVENAPYLIKNIRHFNNIYHANAAYYKQTVHLNFGGTAPRAGVTFNGNYNGNNKRISGIVRTVTMTASSPTSGSFGGLFDICGGTIRGISSYVATVSVTVYNVLSAYHIGGVVGTMTEGSSIAGLMFATTVSSNTHSAYGTIGGVAGLSGGVVSALAFGSINLSGCGNMGGIVGHNCASGRVSGGLVDTQVNFRVYSGFSPNIGGAVGLNEGYVHTSLEANITVVGSMDSILLRKCTPRVGILVGYNHLGTVTHGELDDTCSIDVSSLTGATLTYATGAAIGRDEPAPEQNG